MKTLKDIFNEVYRPKSPDEQKFVDKHVVDKKADRNEVNGKANGDDVFQATNIKMGSRSKTRHGYDPGQDEKVYEEVEELEEKELTKAEMKKREELVKKMKGKGWSDRYGKRGKEVMYATATKMAKKMAEEKECEDEDDEKEMKGKKKKLTKEDIINRTIQKYMPDVAEYSPPTMEERLVAKMEGFSEGHIHTLLDLFNSLNEDNQYRMLDKADTREGIIELINFAIETRGDE